MRLKNAIQALRKEGLAKELKPKLLQKLVSDELDEDLDELDGTEILFVLDAFYNSDGGKNCAIEDGYIRHDWRFGQETDDLIAELTALIGGTPIFVQQLVEADLIELRRDDGTEHSVKVESMHSVIEFVNTDLERRADNRRFFALETDGDWHAYFLLDQDKYKRLVEMRLLPFEGTEGPQADPVDTSKPIKFKPERTDDYMTLAKLHFERKQYDQSLQAYNEYINRIRQEMADRPSALAVVLTRALVERANVLEVAERFQEAITDYSEIVALNPEYPASHTRGRAALIGRGRAYRALSEYQKAIDDFNSSLKIQGDPEVKRMLDETVKAMKSSGNSNSNKSKSSWWPF